ncbi:lipopolysaccharide biosynthesis protein [Rhodopirellula sp. MGV]|uniref:lipopolysaccharide biosynthesis protein n=1 Tax=Rhodopirellula sp. MGV TaxID=2023130 RepID=UPI0013040F35|nr:lipopolysaccharide biosynthesis protein [Rhodopirellula sp. MGV]
MSTKSAVRWSVISGYAMMLIRIVVSVALARLLAPEVFGLYSMGYVLVGIAGKLKTMGFSSAIIQRTEITRPYLNAIFWANFALCGSIGLVIAATAPLSAMWFGEAVLFPVTLALSLTLLGPGLTLVSSAMLQKQFAFNRLAIREVGEILVGAIATILSAIMGFGVWSLVFGELSGMAYRIISIHLIYPFIPGRDCDWKNMRESAKFGINVTAARLIQHLAVNIDVFAIGSLLGPVPLGFYAIAAKYMRLPRDLVDRIANRVLFSVFCRDQNDPERLADVFLRSRSVTCLVVFPVMFGMAVLAEPFVIGVLGEKWIPSINVLRLLSIACAVESVGATNRKLLIATNRTHHLVRLSIINAVVRGIFVSIGCWWNIEIVAIAFLLSSFVTTPMSLRMVIDALPTLNVRRLTVTILQAAYPTLVMCLVLTPLTFLLSSWNAHPLVNLAIGSAVGVATYAIALIMIAPPGVADIFRLLPNKLRRLPGLKTVAASL